MGFLDHSTNNIIVDAVLTDLGRTVLARNDGTFSISRYAFADDEVDYGIIAKFGRTVGKEKIVKNTPILDANTNASLGLKYKLLSLAESDLERMPIIELTGLQGVLNTTGNTPVLSIVKNKSASFQLSQTIVNEDVVPASLVDRAFFVQVDNRFIELASSGQPFIDPNNIATYRIIAATGSTTKGGALLTIAVRAKAITDSQFTTFGNVSNKTTITTYMKVQGVQSGALTNIEVQISKT